MGSLAATVPADVNQLAQLRQQLSAWLAAAGVAAELRAGVVLATNEAAGNVIQHAVPCNSLSLRAAIDEHLLTVEITDTGNWDGQVQDGNGENNAGGRGLLMIRQLVEHVEIRTSRQGTTIRMQQPV